MSRQNDGKAVIQRGAIVIRLPIKNLPTVLEGAWASAYGRALRPLPNITCWLCHMEIENNKFVAVERTYPCHPGKCERAARKLCREARGASQQTSRPCTCHPKDNPPKPCAQKFAYSECVRAHERSGVSSRAKSTEAKT